MDEHVYVLKLWREGRETVVADVAWRGSLEDALSGEKTYFSELTDLFGYLETCLTEQDLTPEPPPLHIVPRLGKMP